MRVLLSTIGSRGDVQPLVALGQALTSLGQEVRLCVPPDFCGMIEQLGMSAVPIGPELRSTGKGSLPETLTPEQRRRMIEGTVATQFATIAQAAQGCDVIVGATALQIAAPSIAEKMGIPYTFVAYCPAVLPSARHAPPVLGWLGDTPTVMSDYSELWAKDAQRWNDMWLPLLNGNRAAIGLAPVDDVRRHVLTAQPWLASDPALAPWPDAASEPVFQTGAWIVRDERPLSEEIESFLASGDAPIYFGFGSIRATPDLARVMVESARAVGRRAILSRGWADLALPDDAPDCLAIGEVNQQALFPRVAAVVHHGGAGTTTAAARAGVPQVVVPQMYDQHYFAARVNELGVGAAHAPGAATTESLIAALERALRAEVAERARALAGATRGDGALVAARRIVEEHARVAAAR
jgi:vancomycin aglycone glucosyltransferase